MEFKIYSMIEMIENARTIRDNHIVIRIGEIAGYIQFPLSYNDQRLSELEILCDDVEKECKGMKLFSQHNAESIKAFVEKWYRKYHNDLLIICHCVAGISRSAGCIAALSRVYIGDDSWVWNNDQYVPNTMIYERILEVYRIPLPEDYAHIVHDSMMRNYIQSYEE